MVAETDSLGNLFEQYKRFCYTFGRSFDRNPNRDIIKLIYQANLEMTPGTFTSLWIGTTILVGFVMVIIAAILFLLPQSPFSIPDPAPFILLFALIGSAAIAIGFPFYLQNQIENKKRDIDTHIPDALAFMSILAIPCDTA